MRMQVTALVAKEIAVAGVSKAVMAVMEALVVATVLERRAMLAKQTTRPEMQQIPRSMA
jgi:hypothetical protein